MVTPANTSVTAFMKSPSLINKVNFPELVILVGIIPQNIGEHQFYPFSLVREGTVGKTCLDNGILSGDWMVILAGHLGFCLKSRRTALPTISRKSWYLGERFGVRTDGGNFFAGTITTNSLPVQRSSNGRCCI